MPIYREYTPARLSRMYGIPVARIRSAAGREFPAEIRTGRDGRRLILIREDAIEAWQRQRHGMADGAQQTRSVVSRPAKTIHEFRKQLQGKR